MTSEAKTDFSIVCPAGVCIWTDNYEVADPSSDNWIRRPSNPPTMVLDCQNKGPNFCPMSTHPWRPPNQLNSDDARPSPEEFWDTWTSLVWKMWLEEVRKIPNSSIYEEPASEPIRNPRRRDDGAPNKGTRWDGSIIGGPMVLMDEPGRKRKPRYTIWEIREGKCEEENSTWWEEVEAEENEEKRRQETKRQEKEERKQK